MARGTFYDALGGIRAPRSASTGLRSTLLPDARRLEVEHHVQPNPLPSTGISRFASWVGSASWSWLDGSVVLFSP